jgi:hypothetical protein
METMEQEIAQHVRWVPSGRGLKSSASGKRAGTNSPADLPTVTTVTTVTPAVTTVTMDTATAKMNTWEMGIHRTMVTNQGVATTRMRGLEIWALRQECSLAPTVQLFSQLAEVPR